MLNDLQRVVADCSNAFVDELIHKSIKATISTANSSWALHMHMLTLCIAGQYAQMRSQLTRPCIKSFMEEIISMISARVITAARDGAGAAR